MDNFRPSRRRNEWVCKRSEKTLELAGGRETGISRAESVITSMVGKGDKY